MIREWIILITAAVVIAACAGSPQPFDYHDDRNEKPGPGLFSGEKGGFILYGGPDDKSPKDNDASADEPQPEKDPQ